MTEICLVEEEMVETGVKVETEQMIVQLELMVEMGETAESEDFVWTEETVETAEMVQIREE